MNGINSATSAKFLMEITAQRNAVQRNAAQKEMGHHPDKLREVSADFESLFLNQMLDVMRDSVVESELLPNNHGEKVFRSMLDQEFSKIAAKNGSLGLGKMIYNELKPRLDS